MDEAEGRATIARAGNDLWQRIVRRIVDPEVTEREFLGSSASPRKCRFCEHSESQTTFRKEAHAVPRALGNRSLLCADECDTCNEAGSVAEGDLVSVFAMARAIAMIRPRERTFKVKGRGKQASHVAVEPGARKLDFVVPDLVDRSVRVRRTSLGFDVSVDLPPFRPINVAKALARMAWFVLPEEERARARHIRRWIIGSEAWAFPTIWLCDLDLEGILVAPVLEVLKPVEDAPWRSPILDVRLSLGRSAVIVHLPDESWTLPFVAPPANGTRITAEGKAIYRGMRHELRLAAPRFASLPRLSHEEVAVAAYHRYRARRGEPGDPFLDWIEAEQDLLWQQIGFSSHERPRG
ncbi:MAG: hypothetical protein KF850_19915 [Labilithrix sp.]|nr:hypothetical protein [Labilithrix sp.]MBX3214311.1 hypothetical protein [Labilithrix sp.]